ncbi:MAG: thioesterase domain-containing protein [Verrucomicrobiota bacterium]
MTIQRIGKALQPGAIRLFCLPPAGAGASLYFQIMSLDSPAINICPIALPGREARLSEPLPDSIPSLAEQLAHELKEYSEEPYAIFGYSMGGLLGYEMIQRWKAWGRPGPMAFFPLAARPPHQSFKRQLHNLEPESCKQEHL